MAFVTTLEGSRNPSFLESEVGLVLKTYELPQDLGETDGIYTIVQPGTAYPSDDASAVGIVFEATDVTYDAAPGSVMVAGRVYSDRLDLTDEAITALEAAGIVFVDAPETTR